MRWNLRSLMRWSFEAVIFLLISVALLIVSLQRDAPTKFIYYNF